MAKLLKESGFKIGLARAHNMMKLRMYEKFKDLVESMYSDKEEKLVAAEVGDLLS